MSGMSLNVNVAVTPRGDSIDDGVKFEFAPGEGTPPGCVTKKGDLNLNKLSRAGSCDLEFTLTTPTISWRKGKSVGTFNMSFLGGKDGGKDAIWICEKAHKPKCPYEGQEFSRFDLGPGFLTLSVTDNNDDCKHYNYALAVRAATNGENGETFRDDPRIINREI